MAGNIKGIVVEIGGDTSGLQNALKNVTKQTSSLQRELNGINTLLKFNPKNTELLSQKQVVLKKEIQATSEKLQELIKHQKEVKNSGVELNEEQQKNYRALQREIILTKNKLSELITEQSRLTSVGNTLQNWGNSMTSFGNKVSEVGKKLSGLSTALAGIGAIGVKYNADLERYTTAFSTFLGSAEQGEKAVQNIINSSKNSPFNTSSLVKANQMLITTGISAEESAKTINALADAVALTGGDDYTLERMASNLQQIQNVGKASAMDIRQFAMAGIDVYGILADTLGVSTKKVKDMDISYQDLAKALQTASSEGGKYYKGQEAMADTLYGKLNKLKKTFQETLGQLTESIMPTIEKVLEKFQDFVNWFSNLSESQKQTILNIGLLLVALAPLLTIVGKIIAIGGILITHLGSVFLFLGKIKGAIMVLGAVLGIPLGTITLIVGAIAGFIAVLVLLYNKCEWFRNGVNAIFEFIKNAVLNLFNILGTFFTETIPMWFTTLQTILDNLPYYIGYVVGLIIGYITNLALKLWNFVTTELPQIISNIVDWFKKLPSKIWEVFLQIIANLIQWASDMIAKVQEVVPNIINKIKEIFEELPGKLKEIGANAIQGLINGIMEKWGAMKEAVINFAHGIRDGIANALQIHSPSRVMRDYIGKNIALGIEQGFTDQMNKSLGVMQGTLLADMTDLSLGSGAGNNVNITINTQHLDEEELERIFAYTNRRFGIAL